MHPPRIYDYLVKSRERVFEVVRTFTPEQYRRTFPFGVKTIASTLTHTMNAEWYYIERLRGRVVPPYAEWPIKDESPPEFAELETAWKGQAARSRETIAAERDWMRPITWLSFPNEQGKRFNITGSAGDFFAQLMLHEVHHRSQVMVMLRELGRPLEDIDFNAMMFERRPAP